MLCVGYAFYNPCRATVPNLLWRAVSRCSCAWAPVVKACSPHGTLGQPRSHISGARGRVRDREMSRTQATGSDITAMYGPGLAWPGLSAIVGCQPCVVGGCLPQMEGCSLRHRTAHYGLRQRSQSRICIHCCQPASHAVLAPPGSSRAMTG